MSDPAPLRRFVEAVRGKRGRRFLALVLLAGLAAVGWWFVGRMPAEGVVEVRWTEDPPRWIAVSYIDAAGRTVRAHRESVRAGTDRFRDSYKLLPGDYWVRIEFARGARVQVIRRRETLPSSEPLELYLEELAPPPAPPPPP